MGKSLPRLCISCSSYIESDLAKHAKRCLKKREFKGWPFYNRQGRKVAEDMLPVRRTRVTDHKSGEKIGINVAAAQGKFRKALL